MIDYTNISLLHTDGIPDDIVTVTTNSDNEPPTEDMPDNDDAGQHASTSFMPQPPNTQRGEDAIRAAINGADSNQNM